MIYRLITNAVPTLLMLQHAPKGSLPVYSWMGRSLTLDPDGTFVDISGTVIAERRYLMMPLCIDFNNDSSISIGTPVDSLEVLIVEIV